MDVRHQGQRRFRADPAKRGGGFLIGNSQPGDLAAGSLQLPELSQRTLHIGGFGIEHGLDHHRGAAADENTAYIDLFCHNSYPLKMVKMSLNSTTAISASSRIIPAPWI